MSQTVTLALEGEPTLSDLSTALAGLQELLTALATKRADGDVTWTVDDLSVSSAISTFKGSADNERVVEEIASEFLAVGVKVKTGDRLDDRLVQNAASKITRLLNGRIPSVRFETADNDVTILTDEVKHPPAIQHELSAAYDAILGRVQTMTTRGKLRFTLYDLLYDKAVSCYLTADQVGLMEEAWNKAAFVKGLVRRDPLSGRPVTIRQITAIEVIEAAHDWRDAIGAAGTATLIESPEESVRRFRNA